MRKWAKVVNEELKQCEVGLGTDEKYYEKNGFEIKEVENGTDGKWYLKGYAPSVEIPSYKQKRINELKDLLAEYDYIGTKIATGCATIEDYKDIIEMCEGYRKEIRILQGKEDANS